MNYCFDRNVNKISLCLENFPFLQGVNGFYISTFIKFRKIVVGGENG